MKRVVICLVVLLLGGSMVLAQLPTGVILGVVKDSSGASVPNAKVTARNTDTNQSRTVVTGDDGAYRMEAMPVGNYQITSEATGFKTEVQSGLTLTVAQEAAVNFSLQIGETSQTVSVTTEAPLVSTTTSSLGGLVDDARIVDLPLNGRNYNDLTLLQPGVSMSTSTGSASLGWSGTQFSSNGAPIRSNTYMLDGAILNNLLSTNGSSATGTTLGVDGIQEYRVITSNFTAEYGMTMGSQQTIVSKSGTNQFHGDVFEFIRNSSLDARNFFDLPPSKLGRRLPPFRRNNFGGAVGGPILKDKTFFFADYEGLRSSFGTTNTVTTLWPTCQVPAGTTSIWNGGNGTGSQPAGSAGDCPQLGGSLTTSAGATFPVASQMIAIAGLYPSPNLCTPSVTAPTACVSNNYGFVFQQIITENYGQIRVDHTLSANDNLFGRYTVDQASLPQVGNFNESYSLVESRNQFLTLAENHIFSTSLLNSARFSFSRTPLTILNPLLDPRLGTTPYEIGMGIQMGPISVGGVSSIGTNSLSPRIFKQNIFTYADDLNYTRGKHSLKFGFILNHYQDQLAVHGYDKGVVAFGSLATFFNAQMSSIAIVEPGGNVNKYFKFDTMGFYAQDAWRVTPRLTLNLGLRYEPTTTLDEIYGRESALVNPATDPAFTVGVPPFKNPSLRNWSPRVGFAWDIFGNGKTALRGGFGEMYDQSTYGSALSVLAGYNPPFSPTYSATAGTLQFPFPIPGNIALGAEGPTYNMRQPHLLSYNLAVERQLPGSMSVTLAYVGSRGLNLMQLNDGNPEIPNGVPTTNGAGAQVCGPAGGAQINFTSQFDGPSATSCYYLQPGVTGAACTFQGFSSPCNLPPPRRNGNFGSFAYLFASGDSLYNGMQLSVNKRLSKGLQVQAAYTWAKLQDDNQGQTTGDPTSEFIEPNNEHSRWGASDLDITNNLRVSAIYYFPNYKSSHEFVNKLTNGWWTSGILAAQTGYPFTVLVSGFRSEDGTISIFGGTPDVPDLSLNATTYNLTHGVSSGCGTGSGIVPAGTPLGTTAPGRWYDPCAFSIPAQGFIGNERRNILRGPGQNYLNFSLVKDTKVGFLGEAGSVQFRAEFFNFLNHPSFSNPTAAVATGSCGTGVLTGCGFSGTGGNPSSTAGLLSATSVQPRNIQFGLKIVF